MRKMLVMGLLLFAAFTRSSLGLSSLINSDGVHPSDATGSPLWAATLQ